MNFNLSEIIPEDFNDNSRVWIYQSSRLFTMSEAFEIEDMINSFVSSWNSHGTPVKGWGNLFFGRFIVLMADETATGVSGCSTDSSVRMIKQMEERFGVNMFDRQMLSFLIKDRVQQLPLAQLKHGMENGFITEDTLYFNNLAGSKKELLNNWIVPVKNSWLAQKLTITKS